jgi:lipopolysaccharide transport protein LptA
VTVHLVTSRLSLREGGALVASDEPVSFRAGSATGTARGLAYGTRDGWLELKNDVRAEWQPETEGIPPPPVRLYAQRAYYDKRAGTIQLSGPVEFTQGARRISSATGILTLDGENRITRATLEGTVRAFEEGEGARLEASAGRLTGDFDAENGNLVLAEAAGGIAVRSERRGAISSLRADGGRVRFAGRTPQPVDGRAVGDVQLKIESPSAPVAASLPSASALETKELSAPEIEFAFRSGGGSLREARALKDGRLEIVPADRRVGRRVVKAREMRMAFDAGNRLESLRGTGETEVVFHPAPGAGEQANPGISRADRLMASFDPNTQTLDVARQVGNYRFEEGEREARAEQAEYNARREVLMLEGKPELRDEATRLRAERIFFHLARDTAEAAGKVRATHLDPGARAEGSGAPTNVLAERMTADRQSQLMRYEGNVRVWQGHDVLESSALEILTDSRRVRSDSRVKTSHLRAAAPAAGRRPESRPVVIEADGLDYFDQGRRARYHGNVVLRAEKTTLVADRMDVEFGEGASTGGAQVERAVAQGGVRVEQPLRRATGERAEYFAADGRIELTGGPPALYDEEKGFTTGRRLTFHIHDDTLRVDGADQSPTLSKHRVTQ